MNKKVSIKRKALPVAMATVCMNIAGITACLWMSGCKNQPKDDYIVAAWVWPSCHDDELAKKLIWSEGIGEWEIIKKAKPLFEGHYQPKQPFWGYEPDDDPEVMKRWIDLASDHKVNTFIFDWYWFEGKPFLESTVSAFVHAPNSRKMNFYLMWANPSFTGMINESRYSYDEVVLKATVGWEDYKNIVAHVISHFFKQPKILMINAWNEWIEGSYLLPDMKYGFGYLEAVKDVMSGKYDRYMK
jgi:hypothetical protein